jgi:lauroyl/myristoyl acyltransferase
MLSRLLIASVWILHLLPLPVLACLGNALGVVIYGLARRRRHIVMVNLGLCFPEFDSKISAVCWRKRISRCSAQHAGAQPAVVGKSGAGCRA